MNVKVKVKSGEYGLSNYFTMKYFLNEHCHSDVNVKVERRNFSYVCCCSMRFESGSSMRIEG